MHFAQKIFMSIVQIFSAKVDGKACWINKKDIYVAENSSVWGNFLIFDAAEVKTRTT